MESQWHFAFPTLNYIPKLEKYKKEGLPIYGALSRNKVGINRAIFRDGAIRICTGPSRRKRPFFSRRRDTLGTPTFKLAGFLRGRKKNKKRIARLREFPKSARWLPRDNANGHRGVSAPSFRDGAIRFLRKAKGGSRGRKNHLPRDNPHEHRGASAPSFRDGAICWERQFLSWHVLKKSSRGGRGGHKKDVCFRKSTLGLYFLCVLCVLCAKPSFTFLKTCRTKVRRSQAHHRGIPLVTPR